MSVKRIYVEKDQAISDDSDKDQNIDISSLDYDSLAKIIMLLPIPERIDVEKVCTKWKEACRLAWYDIKKYKCESSIERCYDNLLLTQSYLEKILSRCGNYLMELSLSDVCNSSILPFIGNHCKNLTILECKFDDNSLIDNADHFVQAFTQLDRLKCIKITIYYTCSNETINVSGIINSLPQEIHEIHLYSRPLSNQKQKIFMSVKKFKNLQKLTVHGPNLDNITHQELSEKTTLLYLKLIQWDKHYGLPLFNKLVSLEYIDLTMSMTEDIIYLNTDDFISTEILNTIFYTCKNLKHLDIPRGSYDVAKISLEKWINFQNLEYLGIFCNMKPDLANAIVKYCKNLKHLRIHNRNISINNTALKKLTELENLECLILGIVELHEESIIAISNNCKKLKRLEITGCTIVPSVNSNSFSSSSVLDELSKLQYLEHLNLSYAKNLKDTTITAIANNCKNLKSLDIQCSTGLTETSLVALSNLENLQKLNVSYLDIITDSFIIKLKGLKELHCNGCKKLTDAGIIQVIKNNPDLEKISVWCITNITINMVIAVDQATKNRTNGIILYIKSSNLSIIKASKSIITSQWLVVGYFYN